MVKVACYTNKEGNLEILIPAYNDGARSADDTDDDLLERLIARKQADGGIPSVASYRIIDHSEVPSDRIFRDSWEDTGTGPVQVNLPKARGIHMDRIRQVRNAELVKKDVDFMRAIEAGDTSAQSTIAAEKQTLRDIPQTYNLSCFKTPEELKAAWPKELDKRINDVKNGICVVKER